MSEASQLGRLFNNEILQQDIDRICKKQKSTRKNILDKIDQVIEVLVQAKGQISLEGASDDHISQSFISLQDSLKELKPIKNICSNHRDCFNYISKMGKNMEKNKSTQQINTIEFQEKPILMLIQDHFIREGQFELHDLLSQESHISSDLNLMNYFKTIRELVSLIQNKNLLPVLEWASLKRDQLKAINSQLLFSLHRQQFIHLVKSQNRDAAIQYARQSDNFKNFSNTNLLEIQQLMTSLLFLGKLQNTKYEQLYDDQNWQTLKDMFIKDSLRMRGQIQDSALKTSFKAGTLALPSLIKYYQIAGDKGNQNQNEIQIDIEIGREFKFHSLFVCPVSREICYPDNPPMLLKCRHVVSQQSFLKMTTNPLKTKFKCPTCPMEQKPSDVRRIFFL